jgi:protein-disulfide isomerase
MAKRQQIREERRRKQMRNRILGIGGLVLVLAVMLAIIIPLVLRGGGRIATSDLVQPVEKPYPQADFNNLGDPAAPVRVVGFADYLCNHCQEFVVRDEARFIQNYVASGQVFYEYYSLAALAPNRTRPVEATYCAGDQGAFWPYRELAYTNIAANRDALEDPYLTAYAEALNLDMNAFNSCLNGGTYRNTNRENLARGSEAGIPGTPTFIVNGTMASRLDLEQVVEQELARLGANQ